MSTKFHIGERDGRPVVVRKRRKGSDVFEAQELHDLADEKEREAERLIAVGEKRLAEARVLAESGERRLAEAEFVRRSGERLRGWADRLQDVIDEKPADFGVRLAIPLDEQEATRVVDATV